VALTVALAAIGCTGPGEPAVRSWDPAAARLFAAAEKAVDAGDYAQGRALMERAAATGEPEAMNGYAMYVSRGIGADPDPVRGRVLLEQAVAAGSVAARVNLGCELIHSEDPGDQRRGVGLLADVYAHPPAVPSGGDLRMLAAGGLASAYLFGISVEEDVPRGVELLELADASHQAAPDMLYLLGRTYQSGWGGREPDALKSYLYFLRGAQLGHAPSQWYVGMALLNESGAAHDEREAYRWVRMSGEVGFLNGELSTAVMLALGQGVEEDDVEARRWYERAATKNSAHALRGLGFMLLTGEGGPREPARGLAYVQLAADAGDEEAVKGLA
jgi:TPR repeat protein